MAALKPCERFGEICPLPLNTEGKREDKFNPVQLPALNLKLPAIPKGKYRSEVLEIAAQTLSGLRPGRLLLAENSDLFPIVRHSSLAAGSPLEFVRSWWGLYRSHGKLIAGLTAELYAVDRNEVVEYIIYIGILSKKDAAALMQYLINNNVLHLLIKCEPGSY